jgi:hypothetical protein
MHNLEGITAHWGNNGALGQTWISAPGVHSLGGWIPVYPKGGKWYSKNQRTNITNLLRRRKLLQYNLNILPKYEANW